MPLMVLNKETTNNDSLNEKNIGQELKNGVNNLKGNFYDLETGKVNYSSMKGSDAFNEYKELTGKLKYFDLDSLKTREEKLAFWINIYNALVVHGIIETGVKESVREVSNFFESVSYNISDYTFSLDDIEHGILRLNKKKHLFAKKPFSSSDNRKNYIMEFLDPRIHFALVCGSKSCPPIGTYQDDKIDKQLDMAASSFINGDDFQLNKDNRKLKVSKIFKWYKQDFGNDRDLINFFAKHRRNEEDKEYLTKNADRISLSYFEYDWGLNH